MYLINVSTATLPKAPAGFTYNELGELVEVGDRFYSQQLASTGSAPGFKSGKVEKVKAPTKSELVSGFGVDISALTKSDLEAVLQSTPKPVTIPNGRLNKRKSIKPFGPIALTSNKLKTTILKPLNMACTINNIGATNMKENSIGSVTPAINDENAAGIRIALTFALFSGFAI